MHCTKCGSFLTDNLRFCNECGAALFDTVLQSPSPKPTTQPYGAPAPHSPASLLGSTIDNKYRLDDTLGSGGMGEVFRATRLLIGDSVALKVLHAEQMSNQHAVERFRREAQAAARLKHPNAVSIYDFGVSNQGLVFLVMELVEGQSLRQILKQQGPLAPLAIAEILHQVAAALDEAHKQQIIHRDIKPDNIIVATLPSSLRVKVLDFGIAKLRDLTVSATNLTQTGGVIGTPYYMSPEQCLGEELDARSDIYSLGIVAYECLTGLVPFNAPNSSAVVVQQVTQAPPPMRAINPNISPLVEAVVLHALEKRREARPPSADAFAREMRTAVYGAATNMQNQNTASQPPMSTSINSSFAPTMQMNNPAIQSGSNTPVAPPYNSGAQMGQWQSGGQAASVAPKKSYLLILLGLAALVLVAVGAIVYLNISSAKNSILSEIKRGNLVKPEGHSAYDLYFKNKNALKDNDKTEIVNEVTSPLERRGDEILAQLKQEANESEAEWAEASRIYAWLHDLRPKPAYEARKYFSQASLSFMKKDYTKALTDYQRAVDLESSWSLALNRLGRTYFSLRDKTKCREYYERATRVEPNWIYPWLNLGGLLLDNEVNDPYAAETALQRALQIDPQKASVHYYLGVSYEKMGRCCEAINEYQTAVNNAYNAGKEPGFTLDRVKSKIEALKIKCYCEP
jgi:serine/threonine protein kinase